MSKLTNGMCWKRLAYYKDRLTQVGASMHTEPTSNECYENVQGNAPPLCENNDDPDAIWQGFLDSVETSSNVYGEWAVFSTIDEMAEEWRTSLEKAVLGIVVLYTTGGFCQPSNVSNTQSLPFNVQNVYKVVQLRKGRRLSGYVRMTF
ncbi:S-adenosyl-L-methionine-dependent methyltransferase [Artemisia annua]|uniref:S-adenosyl-L-methionine-dependent methyltransferase n=1 Tax=Artemisia annua TaxID=35608 RepID=A0A2U1N4N4_ARTAN|nr:S-adenosyl-L-methionine-dependent methyltransferase [Artemisia annua]